MQSRLLALALTSALFAGTPVMAATVYVANEGAGSLTIIDEDAASTRTVALEVLPHNVDLTPDGKSLLIVGMPAGQAHGHGGHGGHGLMMLVCCIPMVGVVVLLVVSGTAGAGALVWALGCVLMMAAMMFFMPGGHSHR